MALAENGDEKVLSNTFADLKTTDGETDFYSVIPDDLVLYDFGKIVDGNVKGSVQDFIHVGSVLRQLKMNETISFLIIMNFFTIFVLHLYFNSFKFDL